MSDQKIDPTAGDIEEDDNSPSEVAGESSRERSFAARVRELLYGNNVQGSDALDRMSRALANTPFQGILLVVQRSSTGLDRLALQERASQAFSQARQSHRDSRPRKAIEQLLLAVAYYITMGDRSETATALGNLGLQYSAIGDYRLSIAIQDAALALKIPSAMRMEDLARSRVLIAEAHFYLGEYEPCRTLLAQARPRWNAQQIEGLDQKARRALEVRRILSKRDWPDAPGSASKLFDDAQACMAAGEFPQAVELLAAAAYKAARQRDRDSELEALDTIARTLFDSLRMYSDAAVFAKKTAALARRAGKRDRQRLALALEGRSLMEAGRFSEAQAALERALVSPDSSVPALTYAEFTTMLCHAFFAAGKADIGMVYVDRAIEFADQVPWSESVQGWYLGTGRLFRQFDWLDAAILVLTHGLESVQDQRGPAVGIAALSDELGRCYFVDNRIAQAIDILDAAIRRCEPEGDSLALGRLYLNKAWALLRSGDVPGAERACGSAEPHASKADDPELTQYCAGTAKELLIRQLHTTWNADEANLTEVGSIAHRNAIAFIQEQVDALHARVDATTADQLIEMISALAVELDREGQFERAEKAFLLGLRVVRQFKTQTRRGRLFHDLGVLRTRRGLPRSAHRAFVAALVCKRRFAGGADSLSSVMNLARLQMLLGRTDHLSEGIVFLEEALKRASEEDTSSILTTLADLYTGANELGNAARYADQAIEATRAHGSKDDQVLVLITAVRIALARKEFATVEKYGREGIGIIERHRPFVGSDTQSEWQKYCKPLVNALVIAQFHSNPAQALTALTDIEHVKARVLLQKFGRWQLQPPHGFPEQLRQQEEDLLTELRIWDHEDTLAEDYRQKLAGLRSDDCIASACRFWEGLPDPWRQYGRLRIGQPPDLAALFRTHAARSGTYFFETYPGDSGTFVWLIAPGGAVLSWRYLEMKEQTLRLVATKTREALQSQLPMPQEWETLSANLSECCFDKVPAGAPLCIVLGGSSAELPIGLINVADQTLLERNPISYLPSLSFLAYLEGESIAQQPRALVIGDSLADLPWARREAKSVAQRFGVTALLGLQAVRFRIAPALGQCSILHVACHATFNYADPERSGFYLADRTLFSVRDAMQLRLSAQLAFLSACESGRAVLKPGDDAIGLSAGLLSAGFKTVISTAWRVPDRATSIIAERFYSELIDHGCEVPEALRRAQLGVASIPKYSHPYFWAAFGVMGDWKNPFVSAVALA